MVLYTKTGDKGETSLFNGKRVLKSKPQTEVIGAIDELNSFLGMVVSISEDSQLIKTLKDVQRNLLTIGSILAGSEPFFSQSETKNIERIIDKLEGKLPPLKNFIIPGGHLVAASLQYARALARRAEREVVALNKVEGVRPQILTYLNRLSDFLFILARKVNNKVGVKEDIWKGK